LKFYSRTSIGTELPISNGGDGLETGVSGIGSERCTRGEELGLVEGARRPEAGVDVVGNDRVLATSEVQWYGGELSRVSFE